MSFHSGVYSSHWYRTVYSASRKDSSVVGKTILTLPRRFHKVLLVPTPGFRLYSGFFIAKSLSSLFLSTSTSFLGYPYKKLYSFWCAILSSVFQATIHQTRFYGISRRTRPFMSRIGFLRLVHRYFKQRSVF